jgi:hypothetical protein
MWQPSYHIQHLVPTMDSVIPKTVEDPNVRPELAWQEKGAKCSTLLVPNLRGPVFHNCSTPLYVGDVREWWWWWCSTLL